jgi:alginate O-acetyltransferase complex protein AlgI
LQEVSCSFLEFNSLAFLIFLPLVVVLYYLLPSKRRWVLLLAASYVFYGFWKVEFLLLIMFSTVLDFVVAQKIYSSQRKTTKVLLLLLSIFGNLGMLFVFKYLILFLPEVDEMMLNVYASENPVMGTIKHAIYFSIPVGISFYTFQTMSYTVDVFSGRTSPEKHLGKFAVFVSFFPQLVAGPIERFSKLQPQLKSVIKLDYANLQNGFRLMLYGFFLKMCIADNLSPIADLLYDNPDTYSSLGTITGMLAFTFQIYTDFAGYSLIAQGAALTLGIKLIDNFKTPYFSKNISEFWRRWHISLSTWFRDYLYIPLGGNRVTAVRWVLNIMLVFAVSGFWHGANWTFVIWGAIHGFLFLLERAGEKIVSVQDSRNKVVNGLRILKTFVFLQITWVFFRSKSTDLALDVLGNVIKPQGVENIHLGPILLLLFGVFLLLDAVTYNKRFDTWIGNYKAPARWFAYAILIFLITSFSGHFNHPFIYFQF